MVAAEASAYLHDDVISYLWTCDTCGYGFVTKHSIKQRSPVTEAFRAVELSARSDIALRPSGARLLRGMPRKLPCAIASRMPCIRCW